MRLFTKKEEGAALLMILIVTMVLLTIGITMLLVNSADTAILSGEQRLSGELPSTSSDLIYDEHYGWITDSGKAFFDNNLDGVFDQGDEFVDLNQSLRTDKRLIIPPSAGPVNIKNKEITYEASQGIYFGTSMTSEKGDSSITLKSVDGLIKVANPSGTSVYVHKEIRIENEKGDIIVEDGAELNSEQGGSKGNITLEAGRDITIKGAVLNAGNNIEIDSDRDIDLRHANLVADSNNAKIEIEAEGKVFMSGSALEAGEDIIIESDTFIDASSTQLQAANKNKGDIWMEATVHIDIKDALLQADGSITLIAIAEDTTPGKIMVNKAKAGLGTRILDLLEKARPATAKPIQVIIEGEVQAGTIAKADL